MELLAALVSITFMDLILSGDNAVVIALASRNLPLAQRKKAVIWGAAGAVGLRVFLDNGCSDAVENTVYAIYWRTCIVMDCG